MVGHQAVSINDKLIFLFHLINGFQEMLIIFIIIENILPVDSPQDNVVNTAFASLSEYSCCKKPLFRKNGNQSTGRWKPA